jgi:hypothetical protein
LGLNDQREGSAQGAPMGGMKARPGDRQRRRRGVIFPVGFVISRSRGRRLPVLAPEVGARTQRHEAAEIGHGADAAEIVIASEAGRLGLVEQAQQDARLAACGRKAIKPGQVATADGAKHRLRRPSDQRMLRNPSLYGVPVHTQTKSMWVIPVAIVLRASGKK